MYKLFLFMLMSTMHLPASSDSFISKENISLKNVDKPDAIKIVVKRIAKANVFILRSPNDENEQLNKQTEDGNTLTALATSAELEDLIEHHKNGVVRAYAFKALTKQMHDIPAGIMQVVKEDFEKVEVINGEKRELVAVNQLIGNFLF